MWLRCRWRQQRELELGEFVVAEREVGQGGIVRVSYRDIVRSHRSEKLSSGLTQDKVGLGRALLLVGALELAVGVIVGRPVRARQGPDVVAVLGLEGQERFVLGLARLRAARKWGPRATHGNVGQGIHVGEAAESPT